MFFPVLLGLARHLWAGAAVMLESYFQLGPQSCPLFQKGDQQSLLEANWGFLLLFLALFPMSHENRMGESLYHRMTHNKA